MISPFGPGWFVLLQEKQAAPAATSPDVGYSLAQEEEDILKLVQMMYESDDIFLVVGE